jgi:putative peptidoglycan lipid II flippase
MVRRVVNVVFKEVRGLHQAAYILAIFAIASQLLAIVRDRLLAHVFGAGSELDLYYAAFRIPDFLFVLFASVLSIYVLLPFVNRAVGQDDESAGARVLSQVFTLFLISFTLVAAVLAILAPWYVPLLFPGFVGQYAILVPLVQTLLIQAFLLGISNLCGVITQAASRFVLFAVSPLLYNLGIILGIILLYPGLGLFGLVLGVVIGSLLHLAVQLPFITRSPLRFSITTQFDWKLIRHILAVAIPRGLTLSLNQLLLLIFTGMATTMAIGSVSVFQFAFNLQSVPLAVIGMSYSVAAFPALSRLLAEGKQFEFNQQLITALRHVIFWSVPITALIIVLRAQIVRVLLGSGAFDWADTRLTAAVLALFVISLVAQAALLLIIRALYAGGRTIIPLVVVAVSAIISVAAVVWFRLVFVTNADFEFFIKELFRLENVLGTEVIILAGGYALSQILQLVVLLFVSRRLFGVSFQPLVRLSIHALVAAAAGGLASYATLYFVVAGINQETFIGIALQGAVAGVVGMITAAAAYAVLKNREIYEIYDSFKARVISRKDVV